MENSKKLTPEEITDNEYQVITECGVIAIPLGAVRRIMKQYAAQQVAEKDALLKEAIGILKTASELCRGGTVELLANTFIAKNKTTGSEAGNDG